MKKCLNLLVGGALLGLWLLPIPAGAKTFLQVKGSDTEVNLVQRLAES